MLPCSAELQVYNIGAVQHNALLKKIFVEQYEQVMPAHYPINNTARQSARKLGHATTLSECWQAALGELVQILSADHLWLLFTQQPNMQHQHGGSPTMPR